ncbi:MAG: hypothetical protein EHM72_06250 [Calditrichaeota bacterium]|nr:MAG: hypothetical protein EHM72_06250 [Calditrichota bacterium]
MIKWLKWGLLAAGVAVVILYAVVCWAIFREVDSIVQTAKNTFTGDKVEATIALLESENSPFELKNQAVYALGQFGDARALPALTRQVTGIPCEKPCTKRKYVCQYDLQKAIQGCNGGFSLTRWMYRFIS